MTCTNYDIWRTKSVIHYFIFYLSGFHSTLHGSNRNLNQPQHERRKLPALNNSSLSFTTTTTTTTTTTATTTTSVRTKNYSAFGKLFWKQFHFLCFNNTDRSHGMFNTQRLLKKSFFQYLSSYQEMLSQMLSCSIVLMFTVTNFSLS